MACASSTKLRSRISGLPSPEVRSLMSDTLDAMERQRPERRLSPEQWMEAMRTPTGLAEGAARAARLFGVVMPSGHFGPKSGSGAASRRYAADFSKPEGDVDLPEPEDGDPGWRIGDGPPPIPDGALPYADLEIARRGTGGFEPICVHSSSDETFEPPNGGWGSSCRSESDVSECEAPRIREWSCSHSDCGLDADDYVDFTRCGGDIGDALRAGWCLLLENTDILEWAGCVAHGRSMEGYLRHLQGSITRVEVTCYDDPDEGTAIGNPCAGGSGGDRSFSAISYWSARGGWIHVCETQWVWELIVRLRGSSASDALLGTIFAAGIRAHELIHVTWPVRSGDRQGSGNCESSYLFHNTVVWALLRRYPAAFNWVCGQALEHDNTPGTPKDDLFLSDGVVPYPEDCELETEGDHRDHRH